MSDVPTTPGPPLGPPSGPPSWPPQGPPSGPPPQGPPAGPPPGPGGTYPTPGPGAAPAGGGGIQPPVIVGIVVVVLLLIVGIAVLANGDDDQPESAPGEGEVFLEAADNSGQDPFTSSTAAPTPSSTVPLGQPVAIGSGTTAPALGPAATKPAGSSGITSYQGGTPGLYGGTRDSSSCNGEQMVAFLAENPAKRQAWADAQGIAADAVPSFIRGLTPVVLRGDTRVTNFGFRNGRPVPKQSVLQAGTAVLVDRFGEPQAKCNCGNPLNPPIATQAAPSYTGPKWDGFSAAAVTVVMKNTTVINVITLIDIRNGGPFGRPTGPGGGPDRELPGVTTPPGTSPSTTTTTTAPRPATTTTAPGPTTTVGGTGDFTLVDVDETITELVSSWTVDARAGTASIIIPGSEGRYSWTVPERIVPTGTRIDFGGAAVGNLNILIAPRGEGIVFDTTDLEVNVTGAEGRKSAVITVPTSIREVKLSYGMGFSVTATYTYRR